MGHRNKIFIVYIWFWTCMVKPGCGRYPIIFLIIQRLLDTSLQNWHSDVMDNRKLETYSTYKMTFV